MKKLSPFPFLCTLIRLIISADDARKIVTGIDKCPTEEYRCRYGGISSIFSQDMTRNVVKAGPINAILERKWRIAPMDRYVLSLSFYIGKFSCQNISLFKL